MTVLNSKTTHIVEVVIVVLNGVGNLAAALSGALSPQVASYATAAGVVALALARGLANLGSPTTVHAPAATVVTATPGAVVTSAAPVAGS